MATKETTYPYNEDFFDGQQDGANRSAQEIVPLILELVECTSVVDVECGLGTWLAVFIEKGIKDVLGLDGNY